MKATVRIARRPPRAHDGLGLCDRGRRRLWPWPGYGGGGYGGGGYGGGGYGGGGYGGGDHDRGGFEHYH